MVTHRCAFSGLLADLTFDLGTVTLTLETVWPITQQLLVVGLLKFNMHRHGDL